MKTSNTPFAVTALRTGIPFGIGMGVFYTMQHGARQGVIMGLAAGVLFGLALAIFASRQAKKAIAMRSELEPEGLEYDGAANLGKTGGWLFLTKQRLLFVPHKLTVNATRVEITRRDITQVRVRTGLMATHLDVMTSAGTHAFTVSTPEEWKSTIAPSA